MSEVDIFQPQNLIFIIEKSSSIFLVVVGMQPYYKPKTIVLKGEDAIQALNNYVKEVEEGQAEELTKKQARAMVKVAKGLISAINADARTQKPVRNASLLLKLKETVIKHVSQTFSESAQSILTEKVLSYRKLHYHPPSMPSQFK